MCIIQRESCLVERRDLREVEDSIEHIPSGVSETVDRYPQKIIKGILRWYWISIPLKFVQKPTSTWEQSKWIRLVLGRVFAKRI